MTPQDAAKRARQSCIHAPDKRIYFGANSHSYAGRSLICGDCVDAAVAEAVSRTKADAVALCAAEFERGLLSGRADVAEAVKERDAEIVRLKREVAEGFKVEVMDVTGDSAMMAENGHLKARLAEARAALEICVTALSKHRCGDGKRAATIEAAQVGHAALTRLRDPEATG